MADDIRKITHRANAFHGSAAGSDGRHADGRRDSSSISTLNGRFMRRLRRNCILMPKLRRGALITSRLAWPRRLK